ncbi:MAG: mitochondrial peripheral inner membrane protein [Geoglossum umbratile]|nr:MAG: mitochondrial peripheral inner membrane protein [Geoglossum umbratile]
MRSQFLYLSTTSSASSKTPNPPRSRRRILITLFTLTAAIATGLTIYSAELPATSPSLNPRTFTPFTLTARQPIGPGTSALFTLQDPTGDTWPRIWDAGRVYSVHVAREEMGVWRKYTPIPLPPPGSETSQTTPGDNSMPRDIHLLISPNPSGCVSPHLHSLPLGSRVLVRGPYTEYTIPPEVDEVVFLVGGTGIACAVQAVRGLLERGAKVRILWAVRDGRAPEERKRWLFGGGPSLPHQGDEENPILAHLRHLKTLHPTALTMTTHIDHAPSALNPATLLPLVSPPPPPSPSPSPSPSPKKLILVTGPPGFVEHWAGAKARDSVERAAQGGVGGVLGRALAKQGGGGWAVWKL